MVQLYLGAWSIYLIDVVFLIGGLFLLTDKIGVNKK